MNDSYPASTGGTTALVLVERETGEHYATATVNIPQARHLIPDGCVLIKDYAENVDIMDALRAAGIAEDTGERIPAGFAEAKVARLPI